MDIDQESAITQCSVNIAQGVADALFRNSSERKRQKHGVELTGLQPDRTDVGDPELNIGVDRVITSFYGLRYRFFIRVDRKHLARLP